MLRTGFMCVYGVYDILPVQVQPVRDIRHDPPEPDLVQLLDLQQGLLNQLYKLNIVWPYKEGVLKDRMLGEFPPYDHRILEDNNPELR